ncbi:MAG TPA: GNAT family N-acetyltransferase, partial [Patescibacteria group bacterium]|nr:GNAT family N-acetyltransferase [Patescibacteria group bacterium]
CRRISLLPLHHAQLQMLLHSRAELEKSLGLTVSNIEVYSDFMPDFLGEFASALKEFIIPKVAENPESYEWFTHWFIIHREENVTIGGIGASGLPDENGSVTLGYFIDTKYEGRGFATGAVECFKNWIFKNPNVKAIRADTPVEHFGSQKVLLKNGFQEYERDSEVVKWLLKR